MTGQGRQRSGGPATYSRRQVLRAAGVAALGAAAGACAPARSTGAGAAGPSGTGSAAVDVMYDYGYAGSPGGMGEFWRALQSRLERGPDRIASLSEVSVDDLFVRIQTADAAGEGPGLRPEFPNFPTFESVERESLAALDAHIPEEERRNWLITGAPIAGADFNCPLFLEMIPIFTNRRLLEGVDVDPEEALGSWDELMRVCGALSSSGVIPVMLGTTDGPGIERWIDVVEMEFLDSRTQLIEWAIGRLPADSPVVTAWPERLVQLRTDRYINADAANIDQAASQERFLDGEGALHMGVPGIMFGLPDADAEAFGVMPYWQGSGRAAADMIVEGSGVTVTAYGSSPEAAARILEFLHQPEQLRLFNETTGEVPADRRFDPEALSPLLRRAVEIVRDSDPEPFWPGDYTASGTIFDVKIPVAQRVIASDMSAADAVRLYVEEMEAWREANAPQVEQMDRFAAAIAGA